MKKIVFKRTQKATPTNTCTTIYTNDYINIVHDCCKICWDQKPETTIEGKLKYIEKRIKTGHESILEHSNLIMYFNIGTVYYDLVAELLSDCKYLNTKIKEIDGTIHLLVSGSIRGFKHLFRATKNPNSIILGSIKKELQYNTPKEFYTDFIEAGIMEEKNFIFTGEDQPNDIACLYEDDRISIDNIDSISYIHKELEDRCGSEVFTYDDLLDICTATFLFKNMSRTATHQLVRHRNAITQESQRYVDYSGANFSSPEMFKDEYIGETYKIKIFDVEKDITMYDLGNELTDIYSQLRNQNVLKEDARAFLPSNIQCGKLYMTFTLRNLIKFLELRTDKAAQAEIRLYANIIEKEFEKIVEPCLGNIYKYLIPKYMISEVDYDYSNIDETLEEFTEEV